MLAGKGLVAECPSDTREQTLGTLEVVMVLFQGLLEAFQEEFGLRRGHGKYRCWQYIDEGIVFENAVVILEVLTSRESSCGGFMVRCCVCHAQVWMK